MSKHLLKELRAFDAYVSMSCRQATAGQATPMEACPRDHVPVSGNSRKYGHVSTRMYIILALPTAIKPPRVGYLRGSG